MAALPNRLSPDEWTIAADGLLARRLGPWAREKLFYIERYFEIFNGGMQKKWSRRVYVDLFSGPGRVALADAEEDGSALLALKTDPPFTHAFLNDIEPMAIEALKARVSEADTKTKCEFLCSDCNTAAIDVRQNLPAQSLDLAFIDPTNWQITFETVKSLTAGRRMDLIITFHVGNMKRAAQYAPPKLDAFFGTADWRRLYEASVGAKEGSRVLLDCYKEQLKNIGYQWVVDDIRITNSAHVGLYHLVFASKHPRGEDFWKKITSRSAGGQLHLFRETRAPYVA